MNVYDEMIVQPEDVFEDVYLNNGRL